MKRAILLAAVVVFAGCDRPPAAPSGEPVLRIESLKHVRMRRRALSRVIWPDGFPTDAKPARVRADVRMGRYRGMTNLKRVDRLEIEQPHGLHSLAELFLAKKARNRFVLYHQGHGGDFWLGAKTIQALVADGYHVLAYMMPLEGRNPRPTVSFPVVGAVLMQSHDRLPLFRLRGESPFRFFFDPLVAGINYLRDEYGAEEVDAVGVSGGGWTITVYAAVDERVKLSVPVAASYPLAVRTKARDWGDWEQSAPALYSAANYLELYVLGGFGDGRAQLQILNTHDPCCFDGARAGGYGPRVQAAIRTLGAGSFDAYADDSHRKHQISPAAVRIILDRLARGVDAPSGAGETASRSHP